MNKFFTVARCEVCGHDVPKAYRKSHISWHARVWAQVI